MDGTWLTLDAIQIASPCTADWNAMPGDDRVRFCNLCQLHVYNLAEMTRLEAETLVNTHEGRLCKKLNRRADGTILTRDCPVGMRHARRRLARAMTAIAIILGVLTCGSLYSRARNGGLTASGPLAKLIEWVEGPSTTWLTGW